MDQIVKSGEASTTERSRLMIALLKRAGVTAVPMLVQHPDHPKVDGLLPYASLWTGDTLVWIHGTAEPLVLDPSCLGCAPREIAPEHHGLIGVVMEPAEETVDVESTLGHAPSVGVYLKRGLEGGLNFVVLRTTAGDQPSSYEATIDWMQDGLRLRRGEWQLHGPDAGRVRWLFHANDERAGEAPLREALAIPAVGGRVHAEKLPEVGDVLRVQAEEIPLPHAAIVRTASGYELHPSNLFPRAEIFEAGPPRALDLHFGRRAPLHSTLRIAAAPGCTWGAPPAPIRIENELGEYRSMAEVTEGALVLREAILVFAERIPPARQAEWAELGEAARRARARTLACACRTPPR